MDPHCHPVLLAILAAGFFGGGLLSLWALRCERAAGALGYRLPVASQAHCDLRCWIFHVFVALAAPLLVLALWRKGLAFSSLVFPLALIGIGLQNAWLLCRRERALWLGVVAALWFLGFGSAVAFDGGRTLAGSTRLPALAWAAATFLIGLGAILIGATNLHELARGTMARQRGLVVFKALVPWSRVSKTDWVRRGANAFDLFVAFQPPGILGRGRSKRLLRLVVPVPAGQRGDVEAFLKARLSALGPVSEGGTAAESPCP